MIFVLNSAATLPIAPSEKCYHEAAQILWHLLARVLRLVPELKKLRFRENSEIDADWRNPLAASKRRCGCPSAMPFLTEELWQRLAKGNRIARNPLRWRPIRSTVAPKLISRGERDPGAAGHRHPGPHAARSRNSIPSCNWKRALRARRGPLDRCAHAAVIQKLANVNLALRDEPPAPAPACAPRPVRPGARRPKSRWSPAQAPEKEKEQLE